MSWWSTDCYERPEVWTPFDLDEREAFEALLASGTVLKENRVRTVRRMPQGILKEYRGWRAGIKAARERRNLEEAVRLGLPAPKPWWQFMFFGRPFLLMEDLGEHPTLYDVVRAGPPQRDWLKHLGDLVRRCQEVGCDHRDFHAGNLLLRPEGLALVDLDACTFHAGPLFEGESRRLLTGLLSSLEPLDDEAQLTWLTLARPELAAPARRELLDDLKRRRARVWEIHFNSRARKALADSGSWVRDLSAGRRIRRRELTAEEVALVCDRVPTVPFLKEDLKTRLWRDQMGERPVVVKEFRQPQFWRRLIGQSRCRVSWLNTVQLEARGLSAPKPLVLDERPDGSGLVVMSEIVGSWGLDRFLDDSWAGMADEVRREEIAILATFLRNLIDRAAWPRDLKACNILRVAGNYLLVDHDAIDFGAPPDAEALERALIQLHLSIPSGVKFYWRVHFVHCLMGDSARVKHLVRRVARCTQGMKALWQDAQGRDCEGVAVH